MLPRAVYKAITINPAQFADPSGVINRHGDNSIAKRAVTIHMDCHFGLCLRRSRRINHLNTKGWHANGKHIAILSSEHATLRSRCCIEDHELFRRRTRAPITRGCRHPCHPALNNAHRIATHLVHLLTGIVIDLLDGTSRKYVVELVEQHRLPCPIKRHARFLSKCAITHHASPRACKRLAKPQHAFCTAISFFNPCLACVSAAVQFQIQFAIPDFDVLAIAPQRALRLMQIFAE